MKRTFRLRKNTRRLLVWLVTAMLLWQQMAVAAYACADTVTVHASTAVTHAHAVPVAAITDGCEHCPTAAVESLCSKHCQPDRVAQVEARVTSVPLSALVGLPPVLLSVASMPPPSNPALARLDRLLTRPPPRVLFCSLLI